MTPGVSISRRQWMKKDMKRNIYLSCNLWQLCKRRGRIVCGYSEHSRGKSNKKKKHQEQEPEPKFIVNFYFQNNSPEMASWEDVRAYAPGDVLPASSSLSGQALETEQIRSDPYNIGRFILERSDNYGSSHQMAWLNELTTKLTVHQPGSIPAPIQVEFRCPFFSPFVFPFDINRIRTNTKAIYEQHSCFIWRWSTQQRNAGGNL